MKVWICTRCVMERSTARMGMMKRAALEGKTIILCFICNQGKKVFTTFKVSCILLKSSDLMIVVNLRYSPHLQYLRGEYLPGFISPFQIFWANNEVGKILTRQTIKFHEFWEIRLSRIALLPNLITIYIVQSGLLNLCHIRNVLFRREGVIIKVKILASLIGTTVSRSSYSTESVIIEPYHQALLRGRWRRDELDRCGPNL